MTNLIDRSMIYYGTAGWSYKDWVGSFYPKNQTKNFNWLSFYSHYFNCVEVNSTYYAYLDPKIINGWIEKVIDNDNFLFTIKLHQDFTHNRNYDRQKINAVCYNLDKLTKSERLGGLLIQFPYSFSFNAENANYIKELKEIFQNFNCFIEVRHKSWLNKEAFDLFEELDLVYATIDQPQVGESLPFDLKVTNEKAYIRFHGRNKEAWIESIRRAGSIKSFGKKQTYDEKSARYNYLYSPAQLLNIIQIIKPLLNIIKSLFVIFNNHPQGNAVANALEFESILENKKVDVPNTILSSYPRLKRIANENDFSLRP